MGIKKVGDTIMEHTIISQALLENGTLSGTRPNEGS